MNFFSTIIVIQALTLSYSTFVYAGPVTDINTKSCHNAILETGMSARSTGYAEGKAKEVAQTDIDRERDISAYQSSREHLIKLTSNAKASCSGVTPGARGTNRCSLMIDSLVSAQRSTGYNYARTYEVGQVNIERDRYLGTANQSENSADRVLKETQEICNKEYNHRLAEAKLMALAEENLCQWRKIDDLKRDYPLLGERLDQIKILNGVFYAKLLSKLKGMKVCFTDNTLPYSMYENLNDNYIVKNKINSKIALSDAGMVVIDSSKSKINSDDVVYTVLHEGFMALYDITANRTSLEMRVKEFLKVIEAEARILVSRHDTNRFLQIINEASFTDIGNLSDLSNRDYDILYVNSVDVSLKSKVASLRRIGDLSEIKDKALAENVADINRSRVEKIQLLLNRSESTSNIHSLISLYAEATDYILDDAERLDSMVTKILPAVLNTPSIDREDYKLFLSHMDFSQKTNLKFVSGSLVKGYDNLFGAEAFLKVITSNNLLLELIVFGKKFTIKRNGYIFAYEGMALGSDDRFTGYISMAQSESGIVDNQETSLNRYVINGAISNLTLKKNMIDLLNTDFSLIQKTSRSGYILPVGTLPGQIMDGKNYKLKGKEKGEQLKKRLNVLKILGV